MINIFFLISSILSFQICFFSPFMVDGPSMEPTFHGGEIIFVERVAAEATYRRGDLVVFSFADKPDYYYVKRIIGLPGETVKIISDGVYVGAASES
ncbi:signal peptidase I, partial [Patescibacteria group bacterium]|nr:signal peptidase I [Patescibacteria group bacterium]